MPTPLEEYKKIILAENIEAEKRVEGFFDTVKKETCDTVKDLEEFDCGERCDECILQVDVSHNNYQSVNRER